MAKHKASTEKVAASVPEAPAATSSYTVLARRYRPQTFADLVGQEPVARALANAIKTNRVAHAYLFSGTRGVGKTSAARILAKALNCEHGPTPTPCNTCERCQSIATGEDVDVIEIDGASNRKIEHIREIRSNVQYRPARSRYKIYIIDEVHQLTGDAFDALLKTLEEPPPHVKFIFATTEAREVPITILSRCQRFDFAGIPLNRIVERLRSIVEQENMQADAEALELVARRAGGSMRDAQSLLDQLLAFGGERLTVDQVHHLLGTAGDERILGLAEAVITAEAKKALDLLEEASVTGLQLGELIDQLIGYWRDLMVVQCAGTEGRNLSVPPRHHDTLRQHAKSLSIDTVLAGLDILAATKARMRGSNHARTLVEMALVRLGRLGDLASLSQLSQWLGQARLDQRNSPAGAPGAAPAASGRNPVVLPEEVKKKLTGAAESVETLELTRENLETAWPRILGNVGGMLAGELSKGGLPAISGPNTLVFRFPGAYNQAREYVERPERLSRIVEVMRRLTGKSWSVQIEKDSTSSQPVSTGAESVQSAPRPRVSTKEGAEKVPLVKRAVEVLGASIQRVEDGFAETLPGEAGGSAEEV